MSRERTLQAKGTASAKVLKWRVPGFLRKSKEAGTARAKRRGEKSRE